VALVRNSFVASAPPSRPAPAPVVVQKPRRTAVLTPGEHLCRCVQGPSGLIWAKRHTASGSVMLSIGNPGNNFPLTRQNVADLLPALMHFAATGEI
jgi:hypothetical protein